MNTSFSDLNTSINSKVKYKIIGFGNIFMCDDGIGIKVINELKKLNIINDFDNISLIDGGTSAIDLLFVIEDFDKVIIIDAVDAGQSIGEIVQFNLGEVYDFNVKNFNSYSLHDFNLKEVFNLMKLLNVKADVTIIGIKPKIVEYGEELSAEIENKIPEIIFQVKKELCK